jgi:hypothetical protein
MAKRNSTTVLPIAQRLNPSPVGKSIVYDRETKDYACFLDRQYIGHTSTYGDGETRCSEVYHDQLTHTTVETADMAADAAELEHAACIGADAVVTFTAALPPVVVTSYIDDAGHPDETMFQRLVSGKADFTIAVPKHGS